MKRKIFISILVIISFISLNAQKDFIQIGNASYYGDEFEGKYTASGEQYEHAKLTAAHLTLPFGTKVKVTNYENNRSVIVTVNDRGPFVQGRIIDLSKGAAENLGMIDNGLAKVRIEVVGGKANTKTATIKPNNQKPVKPVSQPTSSPVTSKEIYKVDIAKTPASGFGVQVGSFNESFNFLGTVSEIKRQVNEPVFINVSKQNNVVSYKVILGNVANRNQAESLKNKLANLFPGCFVVEY